MAFVRRPGASLTEGRGAYHRYAAELGDDAAPQRGGFLRRRVRVQLLGLTFAVPLGCLRVPQHGDDEFWASLPPVICRRLPAPGGDWQGTNDSGSPLAPKDLIALASEHAAGQCRTLGEPDPILAPSPMEWEEVRPAGRSGSWMTDAGRPLA